MLAMVAEWRYWLASSEGGGGNRVLAPCAVMAPTMMMGNWHQLRLKD